MTAARAALLIALAALSLSYAASFGYSRIQLGRIWTVESDGPGSELQFDGLLALNGSHQEIVFISAGPDGAIAAQHPDGTVHLLYNGTMPAEELRISGKAIVDIDFDTSLRENPALEWEQRNFTEFTEPDGAIREQARELSAPSTLDTVLNLASWVHGNVEYDLTSSGKKTAREVFAERRGVCVEYSHLFISMARSLGLETRYVSGYVLADAWQPHAWAEVMVPGYGWLPVDPTFGEIGSLDNSHVTVAYGQDQSSIYDQVYSSRPGIAFSVQDTLEPKMISEDPRGLGTSIAFNENSLLIDVSVKNTREEFVFASYLFSAPADYGGNEEHMLLLKPSEERHFYYTLNNSLFMEGYTYTIPLSASANDAVAETSIVIGKARAEDVQEGMEGTSCELPAFMMMTALAGAFLAYSTILRNGGWK